MKNLKYIFIGATILALLSSCGGKKEETGPEAVVEAFNRALAAGDLRSALELCDTVSMRGYIENYQNVMNSLQKKDSCAFSIASSILAGAEFEVKDTEKNGDERVILYTLHAEGNEMTRKATLKKEEGAWRVKAITDAI